MKINQILIITILLIFTVSIMGCNNSVEEEIINDPINEPTTPSNGEEVVMECMNMPPPSYCESGTTLIRTGTDEEGCTTWGCE